MRPSVPASILACGLGLYGGAFFLLQPAAPVPEVVEAAAREVLQGAKADDLVVLLPGYARGPRRWLGHLQTVTPSRPEVEDYERADTVWLFAQFGAGRPIQAGLHAQGWSAETIWKEGGVEVTKLRNPTPWRRTWVLEEVLDEARLEHLFKGAPEICKRRDPGPKLGCRRESAWLYVAPEWHWMGDQLRRCLWAHPPGQGALRLTVGSLPRAGVLRLQGGHTLQSRNRARAPVMVDVQFEGGGGGRLTFELEDMWRPFRLPVPATSTGTVSFTIWSPDAGANHFCFTADVRQRSGAAS